MKICIIGAGYVGLVSAACFAEFGWNVRCVDKDVDRIAALKQGSIPIYEPGLEDLVTQNLQTGRLHFETDLAASVSMADVVLLAVGTPMRRGDGHADLSYVFDATRELAPYLNGFTVVTTKSTVPVGTGRRIDQLLKELRPDAEFSVCSNPEFLREGSAVRDFMHPDRVLIGCDDNLAKDVMCRLYKPLSLRDAPILITSRESAELAKYAANSFLAMKISFINEVSDLAEKVGADVHEVATAIGRDKRIGDKFLHPGPGYGGSCFPKDVAAIIRTARDYRSPLTLIETVQHVNAERKLGMEQRIREALGGNVEGKTIGVLGVTFKPNTDDIREAPSLTILPILAADGAHVRVYDPQGRRHGESVLQGVEWCDQALSVAEDADALVVLTEWNEFRALNLDEVRRRMQGNTLVDLRNVFPPEDAASAGLAYIGIGRPSQTIDQKNGSSALKTAIAV